jgi:anthranilate synthase
MATKGSLPHRLDVVSPQVPESSQYFPEEERSKQPSVFTAIRSIVTHFHCEGDPQLGLYGALGYDLTFQVRSSID